MLIKAAINGERTRGEHPAIPLEPDELAQAARESIAAGAGAIHFHARSKDGRESLYGSDVARALEAMRSAIPGAPLGVSTGAWILPDTRIRHETVARWSLLPDFASVNFKEEGAAALAELLLSRGIGVEAGLSDVRAADVFVASGLATGCLRVLLEPQEQVTEAALQTAESIGAVLDRAGVTLPRLLHGLNRTAWVLIDIAAARGYDTRIGFEDVLALPDGESAISNGVLVAEASRRVRGSLAE